MVGKKDKRSWDSLGFDPMKDGYWATAQRIKQRIEEKERESRKAKMITLAIIVGGLVFLTTLGWLIK